MHNNLEDFLMKHFQFVSKSEIDTKNFAKNLASYLKSKDVIVLTR